MAIQRITSAALHHYHELIRGLPDVDFRYCAIGMGLGAEEVVCAGTLLTEYMGARITHAEGARFTAIHSRVELTE